MATVKGIVGRLLGPSLPDWAAWDTAEIPMLTNAGWVKVRRVIFDPDVIYPLFLRLLGVSQPDQYWLEVARLCATKAIADRLQPKVPVHIRILGKDKRWALRNFPVGRGASLGTAEWQTHWRKIAPKLVN